MREAKKARDVMELLRLHRLSRRLFAPPRLLNRRRVWKLARRLAPIIELSNVNNIPSRQVRPIDCGDWIRLAGQEISPVPSHEWKAFEKGCRSTTTISMDIAYGATRIGITTIDMGTLDYITGIRIVDRDGDERILGHAFNDNEMLYEVTALHGFRVAMGPGESEHYKSLVKSDKPPDGKDASKGCRAPSVF